MLASGAITSTPGVITSFSCIRCLLPHPVPWTRVVTSRVETPRTPHGAAEGVTRAALHGRLALSLRKFHATWGLGGPRPRALRHGQAPRGCAVGETGRGPPTQCRRPSQSERGV